eukprot:7181435-Alexandrium_andersonii.AAC.1
MLIPPANEAHPPVTPGRRRRATVSKRAAQRQHGSSSESHMWGSEPPNAPLLGRSEEGGGSDVVV